MICSFLFKLTCHYCPINCKTQSILLNGGHLIDQDSQWKVNMSVVEVSLMLNHSLVNPDCLGTRDDPQTLMPLWCLIHCRHCYSCLTMDIFLMDDELDSWGVLQVLLLNSIALLYDLQWFTYSCKCTAFWRQCIWYDKQGFLLITPSSSSQDFLTQVFPVDAHS